MPDNPTDAFLSTPPQAAKPAPAAPAQSGNLNYQLSTRQYALDALDIQDPSWDDDGGAAPTSQQSVMGASSQSTSAAPAAPPSFSPELLRRASEAGIGPEEAQAFGQPAYLERAISIAQRNAYRPTPPRQQQQAPPPPQQQPADQLPGLPDLREYVYPPGSKNELGQDISGQQYFDDRLIEAMQARDEALLGVIEQQRQMLGDLGQVRQAAQNVTLSREYDQFDQAFASVPEEYKAAVGDGTYQTLSDHSPEYQTRVQVYAMTKEAMRVGQAIGRPLSFRQAFDRALAAVVGDVAAPQQRRETAERVRDARGQFVARPTGSLRGSGSEPPDEKTRDRWAIARLADRMRGMGLPTN